MKVITTILIIGISIGTTSAQNLQDFNLERNTFNVGLELYSFEYEEPAINETGFFVSVDMDYTWRGWVPTDTNNIVFYKKPNFMIRGELRIASGNVDYDGAYMDGTPFSYEGIDDLTFECRGLAGLDRFVSNILTTPYVGIGWRILTDEAGVMPGGYDRKSQYLYLPIGVEAVIPVKDWTISANLEYDWFIEGKQTSNLSDAHPLLPNMENTQNSGSGFRGSLKFQKKSGNFFIEPFFRLWNIDDSELTYESIPGGTIIGMEPANNTQEIGVNLGWKF